MSNRYKFCVSCRKRLNIENTHGFCLTCRSKGVQKRVMDLKLDEKNFPNIFEVHK